MSGFGRLSMTGFFIGIALATPLAASAAAPVAIEFAGVDASESPVRVSLVDPATREREWVRVGGRFAGCEVRAYDAERETLTLARGTDTWQVRLNAGVIATATLTDEERERITQQVLNNLRQLSAAAEQYYLENGVATVSFAQLVGEGPNHFIKKLEAVDGEDYTKLDLKSAVAGPESAEWVIRTRQGVEVRYRRM